MNTPRKTVKGTGDDGNRGCRWLIKLVTFVVATFLGLVYLSVSPRWGAGDPVRVWCSPDHTGQEVHYGYVDAQGKWAVPPNCHHASEYSEGLALADGARLGGGFAFLDAKGRVSLDTVVTRRNVVIPGSEWRGVSDFHDGLAALEWGHTLIFFDRTGHEAFQMTGVDLSDMMTDTTSLKVAFSEGLATMTRDHRAGVVDRTGRWVIEPLYGHVEPFHRGLAVARQYGGGAGVIDGKGETVVPFEYTSVSALGNERFLLSKAGQDGVIDVRNRWVVPLSPRQLWAAGGERCKLYCREEGALMDADGKVLFKTTLKLEGKFSEGLCAMHDITGQGGYCYMDEQGRVVFRLPGDITSLGPFRNGLAEVGKGMENGAAYSALVNKQGKIVIEDVNGP